VKDRKGINGKVGNKGEISMQILPILQGSGTKTPCPHTPSGNRGKDQTKIPPSLPQTGQRLTEIYGCYNYRGYTIKSRFEYPGYKMLLEIAP